mgnify:CR=1 FL=1
MRPWSDKNVHFLISVKLLPDIGYLIDASTTISYTHVGIAPFVDKIFYIVTAVEEEEVRCLEKPNDMRLRTKK